MRSYRIFFYCLLGLLLTMSVYAQDIAPQRLPVYNIAYEVPSADSILHVLKLVKAYYESTSSRMILDAKTGTQLTDLAVLNKDARVSEGFSSEWSYTHGVVLSAFSAIQDITGDSSFFDCNIKFYDFVFNALPYFKKNAARFGKESSGWPGIFYMHALDDCGSIGTALIKTCQKTKNNKYRWLIDSIADYISHKQFRLQDGTLARNRPQYQSVWADDSYMSVPFLSRMGVLTGDKKYFDDAVKQILQMSDRLFDPQKDLYDHGWNVNSGEYDPRFFWGRANGWILMSMAELLEVLPAEYPHRDKIMELYRRVIRSLANLQNGSGFWHNLLDKNDTYGETSCTAMFTYAIAKGINEGWISHVYGPVALTGWNAVRSMVLADGSVDGTCEATTFAHDNTYYYSRGKSIYATHGYGPVLYAGAEMIRLLRNDKFEIQNPKPNSINSTIHFLLKHEWKK